MKEKAHKSENYSKQRTFFIIGGVAINVLLNYLTYAFNIPLFLDMSGTILVANVAGTVPCMLTALFTEVICTIFNPYALYFTIVGVLVAICAAWSANRGRFKKPGGIVIFLSVAALISGGLGAVIQWLLFENPQFTTVGDTAGLIANSWGIPFYFGYILINIGLNLVDKGICTGLALFVFHFIPDERKKGILNSDWKQTPLSNKEIGEFGAKRDKGQKSLQYKVTLMIAATGLLLTLVIVVVSMNLYYTNKKNEYTETAKKAAKFAAEVIDPDKIDTYLKDGKEAPGYLETEKLLYGIRENAMGVEYLYAVKIEKDGCYYIFDLATEDVPPYEPGDKNEFEEAFEPYLPDLFKGHEIDPIESDDISGWVLTAYHPVRNSYGDTVCYVGADVSMTFLSGYVRNYLIRSILIFSGFFLVVLAYGFWVSRSNLIFPINSMAARADSFVDNNAEQKTLDENVNKLKALDIHTGDEVERLYRAICKMASDTAEQVRDIRHYADATARMQNGLIITMADMVENRDSDTGTHIQKTAAYVRIILAGLKRKGYFADKLTAKYMSDVEMSAPLHDVGKINIPDAVLNKPGKLTDEEYEIMKTHTTAGKKIMEKAISTVQGENYLKEARNMAAYHHERYDGKGYPEGLSGEVIPLSARVMAVADVFDALMSPRVYKSPFPIEKALKILEEGAGKQFDPKCVEVFLESLTEVKLVLKRFGGNPGL